MYGVTRTKVRCLWFRMNVGWKNAINAWAVRRIDETESSAISRASMISSSFTSAAMASRFYCQSGRELHSDADLLRSE